MKEMQEGTRGMTQDLPLPNTYLPQSVITSYSAGSCYNFITSNEYLQAQISDSRRHFF